MCSALSPVASFSGSGSAVAASVSIPIPSSPSVAVSPLAGRVNLAQKGTEDKAIELATVRIAVGSKPVVSQGQIRGSSRMCQTVDPCDCCAILLMGIVAAVVVYLLVSTCQISGPKC